MKTVQKDPDSLLDYLWNWVAWLGNDEIDSYEFTVDPSMTLVSSINDNGIIRAWFSGGVANQAPIATCHIITLAGREEDKSIRFNMVEQ